MKEFLSFFVANNEFEPSSNGETLLQTIKNIILQCKNDFVH